MQVRHVEQEVLLLWGAQDEVLDPKYIKDFERDLPRVTTRVFDACGHVPHLEQSAACADAILAFAGGEAEGGRARDEALGAVCA
jgi:pimeloyl-ACP methyl ester carboxylesterase